MPGLSGGAVGGPLSGVTRETGDDDGVVLAVKARTPNRGPTLT